MQQQWLATGQMFQWEKRKTETQMYLSEVLRLPRRVTSTRFAAFATRFLSQVLRLPQKTEPSLWKSIAPATPSSFWHFLSRQRL